VLEAIKRVGCIPTAEAIATLVHDRVRQVDFSGLHASLNGHTDSISEVLRCLADLRSDIWSLRCRLEIKVSETPTRVVQPVIEKVVQPVIQQCPMVQATAVVPAATAVVPATTAVVPATTALVQAAVVQAEATTPWTPRRQIKASPSVPSLTPRGMDDYVGQKMQTLIQTQGSVKAPRSITCGEVVQAVESYVVDGSGITMTPRTMRSLSRGTSPAVKDRLQSASQELMQTRQSLAEQRTASRVSLSQSGLVLNKSRDGKLGPD